MLLSTLAMLLQATLAAPAAGASIDDSGTITVTATRLSDLAADVAACAAAPCATRRDVAVSVAYASALFDDGKYRDAKKILAAAVARVKGAARAEPVAVSQLYNAQATLSMHEGDQAITEAATHAGYRTLREGLGDDAPPTLTADYRVAAWEVRVGRSAVAAVHFARIAERADRAGHHDLADSARLQQAQALARLNRRPEAFALLDTLAARPASGNSAHDANVRRAALATAVRLANAAGDEAREQAYFARLADAPESAEPQIVSTAEPPKPGRGDGDDPADPVGADRGANSSALAGLRWADIGYWIRPDGSVDEVEVLRGSRNRSWTPQLLGWIGQRRYAPSGGTTGQYRIERYTSTADYRVPIGSLIRRRVANPRFEMMPISAAPPAAQ